MRFPRGAVRGVEMTDIKDGLDFGKGLVIKRGRDASIIAAGSALEIAEKAERVLAGKGIDVAIANARFIKPLDLDMIEECSAGGIPIYTVEENVVSGGFGDGVSEAVSRLDRSNYIHRIGINDLFVAHGSREELLKEIKLMPEDIAHIIEKKFNRSGKCTRG
jgi:1-deoxy-D-xylulose-5-phosphate synthase